jgi:hypothetical protein
MPGLVPGIHVLNLSRSKVVDGRNKSGHDGGAALNHHALCLSLSIGSTWPLIDLIASARTSATDLS